MAERCGLGRGIVAFIWMVLSRDQVIIAVKQVGAKTVLVLSSASGGSNCWEGASALVLFLLGR